MNHRERRVRHLNRSHSLRGNPNRRGDTHVQQDETRRARRRRQPLANSRCFRLRRAQQARIMTRPAGRAPGIRSVAHSPTSWANTGVNLQVLPGGRAGCQLSAPFPGRQGRLSASEINRSPRVDGLAGRAPRSKSPRRTSATSRPCIPLYFQIVALAEPASISIADFEGKSVAIQPRGKTRPSS